MISKEERAELREQLSDEVPDTVWPDLPDHAIALLDALDAADERIAGLTARNETLLVDAATKIESLKARIAELEAVAQWRPIEEAPYDVELLLTDGANVISGNKYRNYWNFAKGADFEPTHFRVLPALPEGGV